MNACTYKERLLQSGYTLLLFFTAANAASPVAAVHGIVTNGVSGGGLRKAYVTLAPQSEAAGRPTTRSPMTRERSRWKTFRPAITSLRRNASDS